MGKDQIGSGKWALWGVPHKGWYCVDVEDLEDETQICGMCESREVRFVHRMQHPNYPGILGVGCVCAEHMEEDYAAPKARESAMKSWARRRKGWLNRKWKVSAKGNHWIKALDFHITVYRTGSMARWVARIVDATGNDTTIEGNCSSSEAKMAAFDFIKQATMAVPLSTKSKSSV